MKHFMKLLQQPFEQISSGRKTIELRLFDEKDSLLKSETRLNLQISAVRMKK